MTKQVSTPPAGNGWVAVEEFFASKTGLFLGGAVLGLLGMAMAGQASIFDYWLYLEPPRYSPNLALYRIGFAVTPGLFGFVLGWFFSRDNSTARMVTTGVLVGMMGYLIAFDHGPVGWGTATFVAFFSFFAGLGYWLRGVVARITERPTTFGSACWATTREMMLAGIVTAQGFRLGFASTSANGLEPLSYVDDRHMLTVAPNRSGKGTCTIIPNLLTYEGSIVVIDPKGENAMITAGHRKEMGQEVFVFDPWGITGLETACFNPLDWLVPGDVDIGENSLLLADAIIMMESKSEPFFDNSSKATLDGLILYVATDPAEDGQRNLGRVRDLLMLDGDDLQALFKRMLKSPHHKVRATGASMLQKDPKLLSNILASMQAQTAFLDSARVRESLSRSDFSFADLKTKPMTIYLVLPSDRLEAYGRLLRLLIQQALTVNARNIEQKPDKSVLFILDEMPALGRLSMVEQAFGLMAGYGIQIHGIAQDMSQLHRIYGDGWETFVANAGVLQYFGSRDSFTAEYFSKLCGETTVWNFSTAIARAFGITRGKEISESDTTTTTDTATGTQRKLAYPDELMRMPSNRQLLLIGNMNPIMANKVPWFEDPELKDRGVNLYAKDNA